MQRLSKWRNPVPAIHYDTLSRAAGEHRETGGGGRRGAVHSGDEVIDLVVQFRKYCKTAGDIAYLRTVDEGIDLAALRPGAVVYSFSGNGTIFGNITLTSS